MDPSGQVMAALDAKYGFQFSQPASSFNVPIRERTHAFQLRDTSACYSQVKLFEARRRALYQHVLFIRADYYFLTTLPSLKLLQRVHPKAVWIPDGVDSDGIQDRMAIVHRTWASVYFDRWTMLFNGTLLPFIRRARSTSGEDEEYGAEWLLLVALRAFRVPVRRFAPVAAAICTGTTGYGSGSSRYQSCSRPFVFDDSGDIRFRYSQEGSEAMITARWLRRDWVWRATPMPWVYPECFTSMEVHKLCCDLRLNGWGGRATCFNDVYYYWRCCGSGEHNKVGYDRYDSIARWRWGAQGPSESAAADGVWVAPPPEVAGRNLADGIRELCIPISSGHNRCADAALLSGASETVMDTRPPLFTRVDRNYNMER